MEKVELERKNDYKQHYVRRINIGWEKEKQKVTAVFSHDLEPFPFSLTNVEHLNHAKVCARCWGYKAVSKSFCSPEILSPRRKTDT